MSKKESIQIKDFGKIRKCKCCGKAIDMTFRDMENYVYKFPKPKGGFDYCCSWHCYREIEKKLDLKKSREEKAYLLNKYGGVLTLEECNTIEAVKAYCAFDVDKDSPIHTREQYEIFMKRHRKQYNQYLKDSGGGIFVW